jgi:uncharacterized protein Yka (UPF0111/DUF47 family)
MSNEERDTLRELLETYHEGHQKAHEEMMDKIKSLNEKIDPIVDVYSQFAGFGSVAKGFFTWVVIPVSVVIGIWLTILQIFKGK